jgi:hypothetical protein
MAKNIIGQQDGENGRNETYFIPGRGYITRDVLVEEVEQGKHPGFTTTTINGEEFVKGKPNSSENDNINRD